MKKCLLFCVIVSVLTISCDDNGTIPEDEFIKVYVDILVAKDTLQNKSIPPDSIKAIVLKKYNIPDSVYKRTIDYYNASEERWEKFFDKAIKYVEGLKAAKGK